MTDANDSIIGVILAAGKGSRMSLLPTRLPKPVLPVLGEPLLYHQLRAMASVGIRHVYIVVGERGYEVVREIERLPGLGLSIDYVEQGETHGIAHCVGCLEPHIDRPFLLFLGDIYFVAPRLKDMLQEFEPGGVDAVLAAFEESSVEAIRRNFCIVTDETGRAMRVIEKPRRPRSMVKGVGLYLFSPVVFDAIRRTPRTAMRDEYEITDSIQIMIDDECEVRVSMCVENDLNVTGPRDLLDINLDAMRHEGAVRFLGEDVELGDAAVVEEAVVGARARIGNGAQVRRAVVFRDVAVPDGARIEQAVVTENGVCRVE